MVTAFGAAPPDFDASTLLDVTTINAQLVIDWSSGTVAPFAVFNSSEIDVNITQQRPHRSAGCHPGRSANDQCARSGFRSADHPRPDQSNTVYTIGHSVSGSFENFMSFASFITQLQTELNGSVLVTGITALGPYTSSTYTLSAASMTLFLND